MFTERRFYLNKSNSKYIVVGVKPSLEGFKRIMTLCTKGFNSYQHIYLERTHLTQLYDHLKAIEKIKKGDFLYPDIYVYADEELNKTKIKFYKTKFSGDADVYKLETPDEKYMYLGIISLKNLIDMESLLFSAYDELNPENCRRVFEELLDEAALIPFAEGNIYDVIKDNIMKSAASAWVDRDLTIQTALHFSYFLINAVLKIRNKS